MAEKPGDDDKSPDTDRPARPQDRTATDEHDGKPMRDLEERKPGG